MIRIVVTLALLLLACSPASAAGRGCYSIGRTSSIHVTTSTGRYTTPGVTPPKSWQGPSKVITQGTNHYIHPPALKTR